MTRRRRTTSRMNRRRLLSSTPADRCITVDLHETAKRILADAEAAAPRRRHGPKGKGLLANGRREVFDANACR